MKEKKTLKRTLCALTAAVLLCMTACGSTDSSADASSGSGTDNSSSAAGDSSQGEGGEKASEYTRERLDIPVEEVTETRGDFDLSDVQNESSVPADFEAFSEAEDCKYSDSVKIIDKGVFGEFSGKGFAALGSEGDIVEFEVDFPETGAYDFHFMAACSSPSTNAVYVDGREAATFETQGKEFYDSAAEKVDIEKGKHKVGVISKDGGIAIDSITIKAAALVDLDQFKIDKTLSNPNASDETKRLYSFLCDVYGKYIISGQFSADNRGKDGPEFDEFMLKTGKYPAMMGLDLIEASPNRAEHGSSPGLIVETAKDWYDNNGIVTICWHWNHPSDDYIKGSSAWWEGFYTKNSNFSLAKALSGEDPAGYDYLIRDIDAIAMYLQELDDYHVPVLWRPLHEGGGDPKWNNPWFWWGSSGADAYKELWKLMYDRLTNYHHCNNLIWVWNGQNVDYYPGDEYVDIMGYDSYPEVHGDHSPQKGLWDYTKSTTQTKKIIAMTENGAIPDPDSCFTEGIRWAYFCTWNGEFILKDFQLGCEHNELDYIKKIMDHERVLTLDEMPNLKAWPIE